VVGELRVSFFGSQLAESRELAALLGRDPGDLVVRRRRREDDESVHEIRPAGCEGESDAPTRRPPDHAHALDAEGIEHRREVVRGGCHGRPLSGGNGIRAAVSGPIDGEERHISPLGLGRIGIEAAGARRAMAEDDDPLLGPWMHPLRR
jgi:hypothetical protein